MSAPERGQSGAGAAAAWPQGTSTTPSVVWIAGEADPQDQVDARPSRVSFLRADRDLAFLSVTTHR